MGIFDKVKKMINIPEEDYYDELQQPDDYMTYNPGDDDSAYTKPLGRKKASDSSENEGNVVSIHATAKLQVVLAKPERYEDAGSIADNLNSKRTVVLNLEAASKEVARRLVDFLSGVSYANHGDFRKVANCTYIITPYNVDVMGDLIDELENTGVFF